MTTHSPYQCPTCKLGSDQLDDECPECDVPYVRAPAPLPLTRVPAEADAIVRELHDQMDTAGYTYAEEAAFVIATQGIVALQEQVAEMGRTPSHSPLKLFVYDLALRRALHP